MPSPPAIPFASQPNPRKKQRSAQARFYERRFLVGILMGLLGLTTLLAAWVTYGLSLNFSLTWFLIGAGGLQGLSALWRDAARLRPNQTVLHLGMGMIYLCGGLVLTLMPSLKVPWVLASTLLANRGVQAAAAIQMRPAVGWVLTAINSGVGALLALLIVLPWGSDSPLIVSCLVGLSLVAEGIAIAFIATVKNLSDFSFPS
ncbi:MAG: hypothetical protein AAF152_16685 [Cyanobacteria bacterium P01_A01_bin.114]